MDKEKEIQKIAVIIRKSSKIEDNCPFYKKLCPYIKQIHFCNECIMANDLLKAGYRKADEVEKETAQKIVNRLRVIGGDVDFALLDQMLDDIEFDYGIKRN